MTSFVIHLYLESIIEAHGPRRQVDGVLDDAWVSTNEGSDESAGVSLVKLVARASRLIQAVAKNSTTTVICWPFPLDCYRLCALVRGDVFWSGYRRRRYAGVVRGHWAVAGVTILADGLGREKIWQASREAANSVLQDPWQSIANIDWLEVLGHPVIYIEHIAEDWKVPS